MVAFGAFRREGSVITFTGDEFTTDNFEKTDLTQYGINVAEAKVSPPQKAPIVEVPGLGNSKQPEVAVEQLPQNPIEAPISLNDDFMASINDIKTKVAEAGGIKGNNNDLAQTGSMAAGFSFSEDSLAPTSSKSERV
jgi:hypothetical protein